MRLSTCGNVVMFQPLDLPDPDAGRPRMPAACGSVVPRLCEKWPASRTDLILAMGPRTRPAGAGMQTQREPKQDPQSRLDTRRLRARMPLRPITLRQHGEDAGRREHIDKDPARPFPRIAVAFRPPWQQKFAPQH